jgi:hypothetical protein
MAAIIWELSYRLSRQAVKTKKAGTRISKKILGVIGVGIVTLIVT